MNTLEIYCVKKSAVFKKYNWRIRDFSGSLLAKGAHDYSKITTVLHNISELWPAYIWDWRQNEAYHEETHFTHFVLLNSTGLPAPVKVTL